MNSTPTPVPTSTSKRLRNAFIYYAVVLPVVIAVGAAAVVVYDDFQALARYDSIKEQVIPLWKYASDHENESVVANLDKVAKISALLALDEELRSHDHDTLHILSGFDGVTLKSKLRDLDNARLAEKAKVAEAHALDAVAQANALAAFIPTPTAVVSAVSANAADTGRANSTQQVGPALDMMKVVKGYALCGEEGMCITTTDGFVFITSSFAIDKKGYALLDASVKKNTQVCFEGAFGTNQSKPSQLEFNSLSATCF